MRRLNVTGPRQKIGEIMILKCLLLSSLFNIIAATTNNLFNLNQIISLNAESGSKCYYTFNELGAKRYHSLYRPDRSIEIAQTEGIQFQISSPELLSILSITGLSRLNVRAFLVGATFEEGVLRDLEERISNRYYDVADCLVPNDLESVPPGLLGEIICHSNAGDEDDTDQISIGRLAQGHRHDTLAVEMCRYSGISRLVHPSMTANNIPEMMPGTLLKVVQTVVDPVPYRFIFWFRHNSQHFIFRTPWNVRLIDDRYRLDKPSSLVYIDKKVMVPRGVTVDPRETFRIHEYSDFYEYVHREQHQSQSQRQKFKSFPYRESDLPANNYDGNNAGVKRTKWGHETIPEGDENVRTGDTYPMEFIREFFS